jgi:hypothetical protein
VRSMIVMARNLCPSVIAEGVETVEQAAFLCENGCDDGQSYLYAKPLPSGEFERFLVTHRMPWSAAQAAGITLGDEKPHQRVRGRAVVPETTDMQISTCIDSEGTLVERAATKVSFLPSACRLRRQQRRPIRNLGSVRVGDGQIDSCSLDG